MRTFLVALTVAVVTLILGPVVIIAKLFRAPDGPRSIYARSVRLWARTITFAAGVRVRVHGAERMNQPHGAVFVANHVSWFDIFALASEVPWCSFVAKAELRRIPLFGFAAQIAGIVFLDRENLKQAFVSYEVAAEEVKRGRTIVVCPEGTRGEDYHLRPFNKGPFVLAIASQAPIVPTIVYGAREVMPKGTFWIKAGIVDLHFLEPIPTIGYDYDHRAGLMVETWDRMAEELKTRYGVMTAEHAVAN
ncbi:MAG TPA: lysophospholipid acyltransferase family protein [Gemmatimonadaceae bacterium]